MNNEERNAHRRRRIICKDCKISFNYTNKTRHEKSKFHRMVIYCKKKLYDHEMQAKPLIKDNLISV